MKQLTWLGVLACLALGACKEREPKSLNECLLRAARLPSGEAIYKAEGICNKVFPAPKATPKEPVEESSGVEITNPHVRWVNIRQDKAVQLMNKVFAAATEPEKTTLQQIDWAQNSDLRDSFLYGFGLVGPPFDWDLEAVFPEPFPSVPGFLPDSTSFWNRLFSKEAREQQRTYDKSIVQWENWLDKALKTLKEWRGKNNIKPMNVVRRGWALHDLLSGSLDPFRQRLVDNLNSDENNALNEYENLRTKMRDLAPTVFNAEKGYELWTQFGVKVCNRGKRRLRKYAFYASGFDRDRSTPHQIMRLPANLPAAFATPLARMQEEDKKLKHRWPLYGDIMIDAGSCEDMSWKGPFLFYDRYEISDVHPSWEGEKE